MAIKPEKIQSMYDAYVKGVLRQKEFKEGDTLIDFSDAMPPELISVYEQAVEEGTVPLPEGQSLFLDEGVFEAYKGDQLTTSDRVQLESDIDQGAFRLRPNQTIGRTDPLTFFEEIEDLVTGADRSTPEIEALPDWSQLPEKNQFNMDAFFSALGTMSTGPKETAQIIKSGFPSVGVRQDSKGNYILQSGIDGQEYAIKPGFRPSDIPRAGFTAAEFTPAGRTKGILRQAASAVGTQAVVEGTQTALGGDFDAKEILAAGVGAGALTAGAKVLQKTSPILKRGYQRFIKRKPSKSVVVPEAVETVAEDLVPLTKKAAKGSAKAQALLAEQVNADPKILASAQRLDVVGDLQSRHATTNSAYREIEQAIATGPGSASKKAEDALFLKVSEKADDLISELDGTQDFSQLSSDVKEGLKKGREVLHEKAKGLYREIDEAVPKQADAPAANFLKFLHQKIDDFRGIENLEPDEKKLFKQFGGESGKTQSYSFLEKTRKKLTTSRRKKQGEFANLDSQTAWELEQELLKDQKAVIEKMGSKELLDKFELAQKSTAMFKGIEDDLANLFGKTITGSIVGDLKSGVKKLAVGDVSKFAELLKRVPDDMKQKVVASGLMEAFGKKASQGQMNFTAYTNWYEGLINNKQARNALFANLPKEARKGLTDLYRVSKGLSKSSGKAIPTGRANFLAQQLRAGDGLMAKVGDFARRMAPGAAAEVATVQLGIPGAGIMGGIVRALGGRRTDIMVAADKLITSPAFISAARKGSEQGARQLAKSTAWRTFVNAVGSPVELSNAEQWILKGFQSGRNLKEE